MSVKYEPGKNRRVSQSSVTPKSKVKTPGEPGISGPPPRPPQVDGTGREIWLPLLPAPPLGQVNDLAKARDELSTQLSFLCDDEQKAKKVAERANLSVDYIKSGAGIHKLWNKILLKAESCDQLDVLIKVLKKEYGKSQNFREALDRYLSALEEIKKAQSSTASTTGSRETDPTKPNSENLISGQSRSGKDTRPSNSPALKSSGAPVPETTAPSSGAEAGHTSNESTSHNSHVSPNRTSLPKPPVIISILNCLASFAVLSLVTFITTVICLIIAAAIFDYINLQSDVLWLSSGYIASVGIMSWLIRSSKQFRRNRNQLMFSLAGLIIGLAVTVYVYINL